MSVHVSTANRWFLRFSRSSTPSLRLFCFPFAGSSASVFRSWVDELPEEVEVLAIQLPGRENRLREPCMRDMDEIVEKLELEINSCLDRPFVFFGHSLGSLIAYELLRRLEASRRHRADLFFASGGPAPHTCLSRAEPLRLTQDQILRDLRRISEAHASLLNDREVLELMLPMLQADFEIYANYRYRETALLQSPIVAIRGATDDYITHQSQLEWKRHTDRQFSFHTIPGSHLFMVDSPGALMALVNAYLAPILNRHRRSGLPLVQSA
jgi:medium-chain acyl-[acyl-carrier-protein] hydrolase